MIILQQGMCKDKDLSAIQNFQLLLDYAFQLPDINEKYPGGCGSTLISLEATCMRFILKQEHNFRGFGEYTSHGEVESGIEDPGFFAVHTVCIIKRCVVLGGYHQSWKLGWLFNSDMLDIAHNAVLFDNRPFSNGSYRVLHNTLWCKLCIQLRISAWD